jgi:hypothetical protein
VHRIKKLKRGEDPKIRCRDIIKKLSVSRRFIFIESLLWENEYCRKEVIAAPNLNISTYWWQGAEIMRRDSRVKTVMLDNH